MYTFPKETREVLESCEAPFVYYQKIGDETVPILASDGFCRKTGVPREHVLEWLKNGLFERLCPDDVGVVSQISDEFLRHERPYDD